MAEMRLTVKTKVSNSACTIPLGIDELQWHRLPWEEQQIIIAEAVGKLITVEVTT